MEIKDSGQRREFPTGSRRDRSEGKGRYDLLPCRALRRVAIHFEGGANKYSARNWEKGQPLSVYMDSALRHAFKHLQGLRDEDHITAAAWNLLCLIDTEERIKEGLLPIELNDLPGSLKDNTRRIEEALARLTADALGANDNAESRPVATPGQSTSKVLADWMDFSKDVRPGCAMGAEWLADLRARTDQLLQTEAK